MERIATRGLSRSNALIISADERGNSYVVPATEIVRAFTQLVANMRLQVSPEIIDKIIDYFKSISLCKAFPKDGSVPLDIGWFHDFPVYPEKVNRYTTALALLALNRLCRMIDAYVNTRVLSYFRVRHPKAIETSLDDCVYSDYGLASLPQGFRKNYESNPEAFGKSVALILEDMRGGVSRLASSDSVCSMILFGPPGTGKSTLPRALAKSADVPFVEITPGDLLVEGEPLVEMRSEDVFKALSFLRHCVVLFDEFDQIIQRRSNTTNSNIFSFTTSTNLTRFADLRESFKENHSVFILSTNRISQLDDAAIRKGRFDVKMGIYHPDLISVAGYVALSLHTLNQKVDQTRLVKLYHAWGDENLSVLSAKTGGNFRNWEKDPDKIKDGTLQASYHNGVPPAKTLFTSDKPFDVSETSSTGRLIGENEKSQFDILKLIKVHFEEKTKTGGNLENLEACQFWINDTNELTATP